MTVRQYTVPSVPDNNGMSMLYDMQESVTLNEAKLVADPVVQGFRLTLS